MRASLPVFVLILYSVADLIFSAELVIRPSNVVTGIEGDNLTVLCYARNLKHPPKNISWTRYHSMNDYKDRRDQIFVQRVLNNGTAYLSINKLHRSDAGIYQCILITLDNTVTVKLTLHVARKYLISCGHTRFRCRSDDNCLFLRYRCDGIPHCADESDEKDCPAPICNSKFRCKNNRCIDFLFVCDGSDNCGDNSDELNANCPFIHMDSKDAQDGVTLVSTPTPTDPDADHFNWLKTTVYIVIGCTVALVIFISFIVIIVFRIKMNRLRARRVARALERHRQHHSGSQHGRPQEHEAFLPVGSNSHYGNIIVNVNNGVQYVPNSEFSGLMDAPPTYAEVMGADLEVRDSPPPAYSTIDRNPKSTVETATNTSRHDLSSVNVMQSSHQPSNSIQTVVENRIPTSSNIFASVEGAMAPVRRGSQPNNSNTNSANTSSSNVDNNSVLVVNQPPQSSSASSSCDNQPQSSGVVSPRPTAHEHQSSTPTPSNIFMCVEGAVRPPSTTLSGNLPSTSLEPPVEEPPSQAATESIENSSTSSQPDPAPPVTDVLPPGGGQLAVCGGKIFLRSDSSSSTGATAASPPIKGNLEVKGGQIVLKPERSISVPGPNPDVPIPRSQDSGTGSLGRGSLQIREGRILLR